MMSSDAFSKSDFPIVLFDSQCLICEGFVRYVIRKDRTKRLKFSGLQSPKAQQAIRSRQIPIPPGGSVVLLLENEYFIESEAVLNLLAIVGFSPYLIQIGRKIPRAWRDAWYAQIARNRHRFSAKKRSCPLPDATSASRFI